MRKRIVNTLLAVFGLMITVVPVATYLILPGMWQWNRAEMLAEHHGGRGPVVQIDTVPPPSDPALVEKLRGLPSSEQAPPLILTYHDIGHTRDRYTVTPEAFASQMQLIHDAGWTTLGANDLSNWLAGTPMPPHSVFITFDDGTRGVWQYADPVLKRFGLRATAFIITGFVGTHQPYYMTWDQITELHNSGRWDMEAHTHVGHVQVPSNASGKEGAFLTTAMWLPKLGRAETDEEYRNRIAVDLAESKRQLILHGMPEPHFLAYPFSAHDDASNPERAAILDSVVRPLFQATLLDQADVTAVTTADNVAARMLNRMDVTVEVTTEKWVDKLAAASPYDPGAGQPLLDGSGWTDSNQRPTEMVHVADNHVTIDPGPGNSDSVQYARFHTPMWNTYTVSADLGFSPDVEGTSTGITVLTGSARHEVDVMVDRGYFSVFVGNTGSAVRSGELPDQPGYHVEVAVTPTGVVVTIDGVAMEPLVFDPAPPWEIAGGIGLLSHRDGPDSPISVVSNLEVHR